MSTRSPRRGPKRRTPEDRQEDAAFPRLHTTPWPVAILLGVLGGLAMLAAFPPYDLWFLLPLALGALTVACLTPRAPGTLAAGTAFGLAFFVPLTQWAGTYAGIMPWIALGIFEALFITLYAGLIRIVLRRRGLGVGSALGIAAIWAAVETLRSHAPWGGLPWGASAFALADSPLLALAPWVGTAGLAVVVGLLGQWLAMGVLRLLGRRHRGPDLGGVWPVAMVVTALLACLVVPYPRNPPPPGDSTLLIAGIQGNMPPIDPQSLEMPPEAFGNHLDATDTVLTQLEDRDASPDLIVWPEDSTGWDPRTDEARGSALTHRAVRADAPILVGTQTLTPDGHRYNMSLRWEPDGTVSDTYAKRHPVPFGEYIPWRSVFRLATDKVDLVPSDMLPGTEPGVTDVDGHGVGILICFEIAYETLVHDVVQDGAQVIVVQSNNALFGESHESIQQLAEAKVMAVVSGRSVVHVSTVGESAIFTPDGRTLAFAGHWTQGAVVADVPLRTGITPAIAAGIAIPAGICAFAVLVLVSALARPTRRTR